PVRRSSRSHSFPQSELLRAIFILEVEDLSAGATARFFRRRFQRYIRNSGPEIPAGSVRSGLDHRINLSFRYAHRICLGRFFSAPAEFWLRLSSAIDWPEERAHGRGNLRGSAYFQLQRSDSAKDRQDDVSATVSNSAEPQHPGVLLLEPGRTCNQIRWRVAQRRDRHPGYRLSAGSV